MEALTGESCIRVFGLSKSSHVGKVLPCKIHQLFCSGSAAVHKLSINFVIDADAKLSDPREEVAHDSLMCAVEQNVDKVAVRCEAKSL